MTEIKDFERSQEHCYTARFVAQVVCVIITLEYTKSKISKSTASRAGLCAVSALPKCCRLRHAEHLKHCSFHCAKRVNINKIIGGGVVSPDPGSRNIHHDVCDRSIGVIVLATCR